MFTRKTFPISGILAVSWYHIVWLTMWGFAAVALYKFTNWQWLALPWLPMSLVGTAVAFYIGFKNNASYDRMWEARKIWGAMVNSSRAWGTMAKNFVSPSQNTTVNTGVSEQSRQLVYRHIAWLFMLRHQLLKPKNWEHSQHWLTKKLAAKRIGRVNGLFNFKTIDEIIEPLLDGEEKSSLKSASNKATQLIERQSATLAELRVKNYIDDFRHMEMQKVLNDLYIHQGKAERIKNFPFPRQYASVSTYFIGLFIILMPFGMIEEFEKLGAGLVWLTVPFVAIVGWVFIMMELVGDYSENPFEGMENDIPMYSICQTIEIDLREMLGETVKEKPISSKHDILM